MYYELKRIGQEEDSGLFEEKIVEVSVILRQASKNSATIIM
jgi:hypothetical protein